jgi:hypothetical protein
MAREKKKKQQKKKNRATPKRAGGTTCPPVNIGAKTQQPCPTLVSRDIAVAVQYQILINRSPSNATVPPGLTDANARAVARQIERLDWDVPQDNEGFCKSLLTLDALVKRGLPTVVEKALLKTLNSHTGARAIFHTDDVSSAAISLIGTLMDPKQHSMALPPLNDTQEDALGMAVVDNYKRFAGADESEVVRFLGESSSIGGKLVFFACHSFAMYLVSSQPPGYEYFFDVADTESEQMVPSFKHECYTRVAFEETERIFCKVLHMRTSRDA